MLCLLMNDFLIFQYQLLASELFRSPNGLMCSPKRPANKRSREGSPLHQSSSVSDQDRTYQLRSGLYDKLASHFPDDMTHPRGNLIDYIPYSSSLSNENSLAIQ